jgi:hypothetical protein
MWLRIFSPHDKIPHIIIFDLLHALYQVPLIAPNFYGFWAGFHTIVKLNILKHLLLNE